MLHVLSLFSPNILVSVPYSTPDQLIGPLRKGIIISSVEFFSTLFIHFFCAWYLKNNPLNCSRVLATGPHWSKIKIWSCNSRQATSHYMNQSLPRSLTPYDVFRSHWVNLYDCLLQLITYKWIIFCLFFPTYVMIFVFFVSESYRWLMKNWEKMYTNLSVPECCSFKGDTLDSG